MLKFVCFFLFFVSYFKEEKNEIQTYKKEKWSNCFFMKFHSESFSCNGDWYLGREVYNSQIKTLFKNDWCHTMKEITNILKTGKSSTENLIYQIDYASTFRKWFIQGSIKKNYWALLLCAILYLIMAKGLHFFFK